MNTAVPSSPLNSAPMQPWLTVPGDWRRPDAGASFALYWDPDLTFGALWPRPAPEDIPAFYAVPYYTHGESQEPQTDVWSPAQRLAMAIAWRLDPGEDLDAGWFQRHAAPPPASVCDFGCGDGSLLAMLQAAGYTVCGVEPDPLARNAAQAKGLEIFEGTAEDLPDALRTRQFDIVVLSHVLEHCLDPMHALRNVRDHMREGAWAVIETPNNACAGLRHAGTCWPWLDVPRHLNFFTDASLSWACAEAGLAVEKTHYRGYARHFNPDWLRQEESIRRAFGASTAVISSGTLLGRLAATAALPARSKCDSVRVVCRAD